MDIKKLKILTDSLELGSLTKAAEEFGYTQSAVSQCLHSLENEIGVPLLIRKRSGVTPTEYAKKLLPTIKNILLQYNQLENEIYSIKTAKKTTIRVSAYASVIMTWIPYILRTFSSLHPDIKVEISSNDIDVTYSAIIEDKVDLAFASRQDYPDLDFIHLRNDPFLAILPNDEKYRNRVDFPIKDFEKSSFIMPYYGCEKDIDKYFEMENIKPKIQPAMVDDTSLIHMIEHGMGVSILSELIMQTNKDNVIALPLVPPASREMVICVKDLQHISPLIREFIDVSVKTIQNIYI